MNYINGIKKCKRALIKLSSKDNLEKRVDDAFFEISEIDPHETSVGLLKEIVEWCEEYIAVKDKHTRSDGIAKENGKLLGTLSKNLTSLCIGILEYNLKNLN